MPNLGKIQITGAADVDVCGTRGGEIQINAEKLQVSDRARIISNTLDSQGGNLTTPQLSRHGDSSFIQHCL